MWRATWLSSPPVNPRDRTDAGKDDRGSVRRREGSDRISTNRRDDSRVDQGDRPTGPRGVQLRHACVQGKDSVCLDQPPKNDVTLSFTRGVLLEDKYGLLKGSAKAGARHVKMTNLAEVNKPALRYYIKQAVKLDRR